MVQPISTTFTHKVLMHPDPENVGLQQPRCDACDFFCMGFRGDWKALVALFNFVRHYNTNEAWTVFPPKILKKYFVFYSINLVIGTLCIGVLAL